MVKRRITKKDWNEVGDYIKKELGERKSNKFRKTHEKIWKEVDRQVSMEPPSRKSNDEDKWRSALELGELSRASEIISADIRRISFPQSRSWFEAHCEIEGEMNEEGEVLKDKKTQERMDGGLRALMTQQHIDFGLKARVDLSVKEAIHHGSYVAEVEWENSLLVNEDKTKTVSSPVWIPHSMWNCYPESSASITGVNAFYQGSMVIVSYMKYSSLMKMKGREGYFNLSSVEKKNKDIEIVNYFGDVNISRKDGDIYLPNSKLMVVDGNVIYWKPNDTMFPQIIYNGWERLDVRDPYFVSPVTKMSPTHKLTTIMANNFVDQVEQHTRPPIEYDGNDPDYALNGGPNLAPGSRNPRKGASSINEIKLGDPSTALAGVQFGIDQLQKGTSVDNVRSGVSGGTEQTAFEVSKISQGSEIRTIDFVDKHELHGLRPFLYLQHFLNKKKLKSYTFFNPEMDAPDFERVSRDDIPENVHFEIVGSKGLLGEEQRTQRTAEVTSLWMQWNPSLLNQIELAKEMYMDAGNKNSERFLNIDDNSQIEQVVAEFEEHIAMLEEELTRFQFAEEEHSIEIAEKELEKEGLKVAIKALQERMKNEVQRTVT